MYVYKGERRGGVCMFIRGKERGSMHVYKGKGEGGVCMFIRGKGEGECVCL